MAPRLFFRSKWAEHHPEKKGELVWHSNTYRRPVRTAEVKGKRNIRHAKRLKVAAMKAAGHFRGDNRPFTA